MKKINLVTLIAMLAVLHLSAQSKVSENILTLDEGSKSPSATLEDVSWITGRWLGSGLDGQCEEIWAPAFNNHMIGTFRMTKTEKFRFFAFSNLYESNGTLSIKVKHFNYNLIGWEEKDGFKEFPLVELTTNKIYFDGVTMERVGDDGMIVYMSIRYQNGETKEEKYVYSKSWNLNKDTETTGSLTTIKK